MGGGELLGEGAEGGAGGHDVVDEGDALALDGGGAGEAEGVADVFPTVLGGFHAGLGGGVEDAAGGVGDFFAGLFGEAAGEDFGLVVAAADVAGPIEGDGDEDVGIVNELADVGLKEEAVGEGFG